MNTESEIEIFEDSNLSNELKKDDDVCGAVDELTAERYIPKIKLNLQNFKKIVGDVHEVAKVNLNSEEIKLLKDFKQKYNIKNGELTVKDIELFAKYKEMELPKVRETKIDDEMFQMICQSPSNGRHTLDVFGNLIRQLFRVYEQIPDNCGQKSIIGKYVDVVINDDEYNTYLNDKKLKNGLMCWLYPIILKALADMENKYTPTKKEILDTFKVKIEQKFHNETINIDEMYIGLIVTWCFIESIERMSKINLENTFLGDWMRFKDKTEDFKCRFSKFVIKHYQIKQYQKGSEEFMECTDEINRLKTESLLGRCDPRILPLKIKKSRLLHKYGTDIISGEGEYPEGGAIYDDQLESELQITEL